MQAVSITHPDGVPCQVPDLKKSRDYCGTGGRSALAAETLNKMGYRNALSMDGGIVAWAAARLPVETP